MNLLMIIRSQNDEQSFAKFKMDTKINTALLFCRKKT